MRLSQNRQRAPRVSLPAWPVDSGASALPRKQRALSGASHLDGKNVSTLMRQEVPTNWQWEMLVSCWPHAQVGCVAGVSKNNMRSAGSLPFTLPPEDRVSRFLRNIGNKDQFCTVPASQNMYTHYNTEY